ncbi:MAG: NAD(P) transhydrogenase subunit alpha [Planctomycetaceae bacterium]|nr:NAD(P) transhydrogenase subunit alpha [Planctomycetaceae bacterium]
MIGQLLTLAAAEMTLTMAVIVFVLAMFVGLEIITKVPTMLHTPLMSGSNAISGITIVGALGAAAVLKGGGHEILAATAGTLAVTAAMINVVGGYLVTHRMLGMFKKGPKP